MNPRCSPGDDSTEFFQVTGTAGTTRRSCNWAARMNTTQRCAIDIVALKCPLTCDRPPCMQEPTSMSNETDSGGAAFDDQGILVTAEKNHGKSSEPFIKAVVGVFFFHGIIAFTALFINRILNKRPKEEQKEEVMVKSNTIEEEV